MNDKNDVIRGQFSKPNGTSITDMYVTVLEWARSERQQEPRWIRFSYSGEDGEKRHHEFFFN